MKEIAPPQNIDAEKSLLAALLLDKDAIGKVVDIVRPEDFYDDRHGLVYGAMVGLYNSHKPIDVVTVTDVLDSEGNLDKAGGPSKVAALTTGTLSSAHAAQYAEIVANKATLRRLISAANTITELGFSTEVKLDEALDRAEQTLFNVSRKHLKNPFVEVKDVLSDAFERIDYLHENRGEIRGIPTGFVDLDKMLYGLQASDLVIVAARPSMGKTSLVLNMALNASKKGHYRVGVFSLEMSKEQLIDRLLSMESGIDSWKLRTGNLTPDDFNKLSDAMSVLADTPIYIDDSAFVNVMEVRTKARRLKAEKGLDLLILDHLQLMEGTGSKESRVQEMSEISRSLKALAKDLDIPVVALSQLSRAVEQRPGKIPQLADLRESGSIEQDADVVMFIYRDEYYNPETDRKNETDIIIAKHRNGPVGNVKIYFDGKTMQFKSLIREEMAQMHHAPEPEPTPVES
ncbi:MAG: replicative DNA helicase [Patescibacteria group bacterium]